MTPKATKLLKLMLLVLLSLSTPTTAMSAVEFLGSFQHQRGTEEHIYVYRMDLWREGDKVFGFYGYYGGLEGNGILIESWRTSGTIKGISLLLKADHVNFNFFGSFSKNVLSGRWSDSMETIDLSLQKLSEAETAPTLLKAPHISYEEWSRWAEQYLDAFDENNPQLSQDVDKCAHGDGSACLAAGNHSGLRGNRERARQRYESGCSFNNANCCLNVGRVDKATEILKSQCTGKSTMENNFACQTLGNLAEKSGNLTEAKEWYRKGCNDSIPNVCPDFNRLENR